MTGGFGYDFSDPNVQTEDAVDFVSQQLLSHGVTSFCPTLVTLDPVSYGKIIPGIKRSIKPDARNPSHNIRANILGIHLEGPFINPEKRGAHPLNDVKTLESFDDIIKVYGSDLSGVSIITLAPELLDTTSGDIMKQLSERNIVVSLGHSNASLKTGENAVASGARFITHLFNAMLPFHHRDPGLVGLLTSSKGHEISSSSGIFYGIIADGIHTHQEAVKIAFRSNPNGLVLVTDAISAMGLEPVKPHHVSIHDDLNHQMVGTQKVEIRGESVFVAGTNTLSGSIATMDTCIKNLIKFTGCTVVEAIECATLHPAQVLGLEKTKGTLNYASDADFVMLNDDLNVVQTFVNGKSGYRVSGMT